MANDATPSPGATPSPAMNYRAAARLSEEVAAALSALRASIHDQSPSRVADAAEDLVDLGGRLLDLTEVVEP